MVLFVFWRIGRPRRKLRSCSASGLGHRRIHHTTGNLYHTVGGMDKARSIFDFRETGPRNQFPVETDSRVRPHARRGAVKNVKLIRIIEFSLRWVESNHLA